MRFISGAIPHRSTKADLMPQLVEAIAREVWMLHGRSGALNWVAVERHLSRMVRQARNEAQRSCGGSVAGSLAERQPMGVVRITLRRHGRRGVQRPLVGRSHS